MRNKNRIPAYWFSLYVAGIFALSAITTVGYILNIVKIFRHFNDPLTTEMILRIVGVVVAPFGVILGYA